MHINLLTDLMNPCHVELLNSHHLRGKCTKRDHCFVRSLFDCVSLNITLSLENVNGESA